MDPLREKFEALDPSNTSDFKTGFDKCFNELNGLLSTQIQTLNASIASETQEVIQLQSQTDSIDYHLQTTQDYFETQLTKFQSESKDKLKDKESQLKTLKTSTKRAKMTNEARDEKLKQFLYPNQGYMEMKDTWKQSIFMSLTYHTNSPAPGKLQSDHVTKFKGMVNKLNNANKLSPLFLLMQIHYWQI